MVKLEFPRDGCTVDTHTALQNAFIKLIHESGITAALDWLLSQKCEVELSRPKQIRFAWAKDGSKQYHFELAEDEEFLTAISATTDQASYECTNLKIGQRYFWRVNGCWPFSFDTADNQYRFMQIDSVLNVRDVGGINIKQGLLYRGAEINEEFVISDLGKKAVKQLKIKTEVNLRKEAAYTGTVSAAGDEVRYKQLPYRPYLEIFEEEHRKGVVAIMEFLAEEENYPVYFHCLAGADRTGMIALYLRALLGESDEDILTDYELTSLSPYAGFRSRYAEYFTEFLDEFNKIPGATLADKTERFLLDSQVKPETLDRIRKIIGKQKSEP